MSAKYTFAVYETIIGSATQKLILLKLADNANDDGVCWPGMEYLSKHCELSKSAILRNLKALEEKGFIQVKRRKSPDNKTNYSNVYKLTLPSVSQLPPSSSQPLPPSSSELPESNNNKPNKETIDHSLLEKITEHWNHYMDGISPNVDLTKKSKVNQKRAKLIKAIIDTDWKTDKYQTDYSDHEYWEGYIQRLATADFLQWQRENGHLKFDQAMNIDKFTRNLEQMRMNE